jgi:hypothetical protein
MGDHGLLVRVSSASRNLLDDHHHEGSTLALEGAEVPRMVYAAIRMALKSDVSAAAHLHIQENTP